MDTLNQIRATIIHLVHKAKVSHVGAALSVTDMLYMLYFKIANVARTPDRDVIILSKGHASAALYAVLYHRNLLDKALLDGYALNNGTLPCHIDKEKSPYFEASAGSLGHGLSIGLGMALAKRLNGHKGRIFVICGDGEMNEGSVWEAVMFAGTHHVSNLVLIVDNNRLQGFSATDKVVDQTHLSRQLQTFGFDVKDIDGHDLTQIEEALTYQPEGKPLAVVAHTIKGKGISFMENKLEWHYKSPNDEQLAIALKELEAK
jgi:transketolase